MPAAEASMAKAQHSLISELERATHSGSHDKCVDTLRRVTDLFLAGADRFSEDQVRLFEDVLGFLVERIETRARAELSTRLALVENAPIGVVRRLAHDDEIIVAEPVLTHSPRLTGDDLIHIARTKSQGHLLAMSGRRHLDSTVTDLLLDRGNRDVIHKLAQNSSAHFSEAGFTTLVLKAATDESLSEKVGLRLDVPSHLFEQLLQQATKAVRSRLLSLAPPATQREIQRVLALVSKEVGWEMTAPRDLDHAHDVVLAMHERGALTEQAVADFARKHKHEELVAALALLCSAPINVIDSLMCSPRHEGLLIPCRVAKLDWLTVSTILQNRFLNQSLTDRERENLSEEYSRLSQATAQRVLGFWQARDVDSRQRH
jgi:uncharacterized protein (DUF2336 family)